NFSQITKTVEDTSISYLRCKNDAIINLEASWSLPAEKDTFYLNVYCTKGYASLNPFRVYRKIEEQVINLTPSQSESAFGLFKKSYMNELKSFLGAVTGLHPGFSSGEEALSRMKVVEAMYNSAARNAEIEL